MTNTADYSRTRPYEFHLWLNEREKLQLAENARLAGLSKGNYLRFLILGYAPKARPTQAYRNMMQQFYRIGESLRLLAEAAVSDGRYDTDTYLQKVSEYEQLVKDFNLDAAGILPMEFHGGH